MLHPVNDEGAGDVVVQGYDPLDPKQIRPMRVAQDFKEHVAGGWRQRAIAAQRESTDGVIVAIDVMSMVVLRSVMSVVAGRIVERFDIEPASDVRRLVFGIVEANAEKMVRIEQARVVHAGRGWVELEQTFQESVQILFFGVRAD